MKPVAFWIALGLWVSGWHPACATPLPPTAPEPEVEEPEQPFSADEGDKADPVLTPISAFVVQKPYDEAKNALKRAEELWKSGQVEAASDVALEAYDGLVDIKIPKKKKKERRILHAERARAATLYIRGSVATIQRWAEGRPERRAEALDRFKDLHDVSQSYPELMKFVRSAAANLP